MRRNAILAAVAAVGLTACGSGPPAPEASTEPTAQPANEADRFAVPIEQAHGREAWLARPALAARVEVEFGGRPWESYPLLWQWSPLAHVEGVTTPTLFLHGEDDHDVPIQQAEEMYVALKKQGVPSVLVRYPGEGHGLRGPQHRLDYYRRSLDWLERWLR